RQSRDPPPPGLSARPLPRVPAPAQSADLARDPLIALTAEEVPPDDGASLVLGDNLANLLALAGASDILPRRMAPDLQLEAMLAFCRQNLQDSTLTPQRVAAHCGISLRTVHLRFELIGQTFGRWLLEHRL